MVKILPQWLEVFQLFFFNNFAAIDVHVGHKGRLNDIFVSSQPAIVSVTLLEQL